MTLGLSPEEIIARNKEKQRQWRLNKPERIRGFHRKYNQKPEVQERKLQWARENKEAINARRREIYAMKKQQNAEALVEPVA